MNTRSTFVVLAPLLLSSAACGDKDQVQECADIQGDPCVDHGLLEKRNSAFCDNCGQMWNCAQDWDGNWYVEDVFLPCSCINEKGFLEVDTGGGTCGPSL